MNVDSVPITVRILDKEYRIACPKHEKEGLLASADYLSRKMKEIRNSGRVIGADKVAVLAALNICHEFLSHQSQQKDLGNRVRSLQDRVSTVLKDNQQTEN